MKHLPGTDLLTTERDFAEQMVEGIGRFLDRETAKACEKRERRWARSFRSHKAFEESTRPNRERFRAIIGAADRRAAPGLEVVCPAPEGEKEPRMGTGHGFSIFSVRWRALDGLDGEGLLLEPERRARANIVALPDCDWSPEMLVGLEPGLPPAAQFARILAENGFRVIVPLLMDRRDNFSCTAYRKTNQPHREFIYRAAFEMGHHVIGFEVQKVLGAVDWFESQREGGKALPVGVIGYGEGGLLAFYTGAADTRIQAVGVSGYFRSREGLFEEPIYRNVFGLLSEFGDAELAGLIAPRLLVVEACRHPEVSGPPAPREGRSGAAPGIIRTPPLKDVQDEFVRAQSLVSRLKPEPGWKLVASDGGTGDPGTAAFLNYFARGLGRRSRLRSSAKRPVRVGAQDAEDRFRRQFAQMLEYTQFLMREGEFEREKLWSEADASDLESWKQSAKRYRKQFWEDVIGKFPLSRRAPRARSRLVYDEAKYRGYEVVLGVFEDVFAYGILLVPKRIKSGERRPVVVCQHGLEGRPQDVADPQNENPAYHRYACRLAERGFVVFAPQNPYIGMDKFRVLQRKANPLGKSLFSVIIPQHAQILKWLSSLPFVDGSRIGFYGLSYGGKSAMRIPAVLEQYCLSICSADYDEWIWKNVSARHRYSYLGTGEYEMPEFNLGNTFNYAEMSWLICPRPFMVERGHHDGVAPDEWVGYEFAKTFRRYSLLGIRDRARLEVFDGPHSIHGVGTFEFLHRYLDWPEK